MDRERDFIADTLRGGSRVAIAALVPLPQIPRSGVNDKGYAVRNDQQAEFERSFAGVDFEFERTYKRAADAGIVLPPHG